MLGCSNYFLIGIGNKTLELEWNRTEKVRRSKNESKRRKSGTISGFCQRGQYIPGDPLTEVIIHI